MARRFFWNVMSGARLRRAVYTVMAISCGMLAACESQRQRVTESEDQLSAAGFVIKPANTPSRQSMLTRLPANKFVRRERGDAIHYVYADPLVCVCLYVGTQDAYNKFKSNEFARHLADEQQITADTYSGRHSRA